MILAMAAVLLSLSTGPVEAAEKPHPVPKGQRRSRAAALASTTATP
jgi:hypothetical protein